MSRKRAQILSREAFMQEFVKAEMLMRRNLSARLDVLAQAQTIEDVIKGIRLSQEVVYGKVDKPDENLG